MDNPNRTNNDIPNKEKSFKSINLSSVDVSIELFLKAGLFSKIPDGGTYVKNILSAMSKPLKNMKNTISEQQIKDKDRSARYLSSAYLKARNYIFSNESKDYLSIFLNIPFEQISKEILDEVRKCLVLASNLIDARNEFNLYLEQAEEFFLKKPKTDTIPYGTNQKDKFSFFDISSDHEGLFETAEISNLHAINLPENKPHTAPRNSSSTPIPTVKNIQTPSNAPRDTLPPPAIQDPMVKQDVQLNELSYEASNLFKKRFLENFQNEFLNKTRELANLKDDDGKKSSLPIFESAFEEICKKTFSSIISEDPTSPIVLNLRKYVNNKVSSGLKWISVIKNLGEKAIENKVQEVKSLYVPVIVSAYIYSNPKFKDVILNIKENDLDDMLTKQEDASKSILKYIEKQMLKEPTSSKLQALAFLAYFLREDKNDLKLLLYEEIFSEVKEVFSEIRQKSFDENPLEEISDQTVKNTSNALKDFYDEEETKQIIIEKIETDDSYDSNEKSSENLDDLEKKVHVFDLNKGEKVELKDSSRAGLTVFKDVLPHLSIVEPKIYYVNEQPVENKEEIKPKEKTFGLWNRFKKSKIGKVAFGTAFAVTTVMAGYIGSSFVTNKNSGNDTTEPSSVTSVAFKNNEVKKNLDNEDVFLDKLDEDFPDFEIDSQNVSSEKYATNLDKIPKENFRLRNLVEKGSFKRESGYLGDFDQLHSIVAQGALTPTQQNRLTNELNGKYNRGEYGFNIKRFRPLIENGEVFKVLGDKRHKEHNALKDAINKFGNPMKWSWNIKQVIKENGKSVFKNVNYEDFHSEDVEFFVKCKNEFENLGIGKNGNGHLKNGPTGSEVNLKINGKWSSFVETALKIRGIIEIIEPENIVSIDSLPVSKSDSDVGNSVTPNLGQSDLDVGNSVTPNLEQSDLDVGNFAMPVDTNSLLTPLNQSTPVSPNKPEDDFYNNNDGGKKVELSDKKTSIQNNNIGSNLNTVKNDYPEIEVTETVLDDETLLAEVDDGWDDISIEGNNKNDYPEIEVTETVLDDETLLAEVDDGWNDIFIEGNNKNDYPEIEVTETVLDDETLLAEVDDGWDF